MNIVEGHPIPQDITGFQFRLIGDMTVKQFAYLAVGILFAWLFFSAHISVFIKFPIAAFFAINAVILAFVPIQGRPADTMLLLFFRALIKPNQYVYNGNQEKTITSLQQTAVSTSPTISGNDGSNLVTTPPVADPMAVGQKILQQAVNDDQPKEDTQESQKITSSPLPQQPNMNTPPTGNQTDYEQQLKDILMQKEALEKKLAEMQQQTKTVPEEDNKPMQIVDESKKQTQQQTTILPAMPDAPNIIAGVVKDPRGNILPNILIEVKDTGENPVRAFKTNQLGQFASATPLVNGSYTIICEDPKKQQQFDVLTIVANGTQLPPLTITSVDAREELRKSLFT
jgi:hypothetical protein